jgi:ribosomal protein L7/L12
MSDIISEEFLYATMGFMRAVDREVGIDEENVDKLLDMISPSLRKQLLLMAIKGNVVGTVIIRKLHGVTHLKINAIKSVRAATGLGLREAKETVEMCDDKGWVQIQMLSSHSLRQLAQGLAATGYEVN